MTSHVTGLSRRSWMIRMAGAGASCLMPSAVWSAPAADQRILAIARQTIGIDTHNHIDLALHPEEAPQPDIDIAGAMKQTGLTAVCASFALDYEKIPRPHDAYLWFLNWLKAADAQLQRNGMTRALTAEDIRAAHRRGHPTIIQSVEGAHWLEGRLDRVDEAYGRGLRHFGLLHDNDAIPPLGDTNSRDPAMGGLTPLGAEVIRECNRLGILVDLAHADPATTLAAIKASKTPVIYSHTGLNTRLGTNKDNAEFLFRKLLGADQARTVAQSGGVVGIWTHLADTPTDFGEHMRALVDICGIDHVCIGTDSKMTPAFGRTAGRMTRWGTALTRDVWPDMPFGYHYAVVSGLLAAGFNEGEIGKIVGGNYLRVLAAATTHKG